MRRIGSRRARQVVGIVGVLVGVWLVVAVVMLWQAQSAADRGVDRIRDLRDLATEDLESFVASMGDDVDDVREEEAADLLRSSADEFALAQQRVGSPMLAPLRIAPVIGRQIRSADALSASAERVTVAAADAFDAMNEILVSDTSEPAERPAVLARTAEILTDLQSDMAQVDFGPTEKLLPPLARAHNRFALEYERAGHQLDRAVAAADAAAALVEGPSRYLLLAANNGEMRAGSGMFLQIGELRVDAGSFEVDMLTPARELQLPPPGIEVDPDVEALWGFLSPGREWRNINLTPRFDVSGSMAVQMWEADGKGAADGVISVDVVALEHLLDVVGPVEVDGVEISSENVADDLLLDQYADFVDDRDERRDRLGRLAEAVFEALNTRTWSPVDMLRELERAGSGRHLMMWSADDLEQAGWEAAGVAGQVDSASLMLSILNRGGNKLDPFLRVESKISALSGGRGRRLRVSVEIENTAPGGLPPYVAGPHPRSEVGAGDYLGFVSLTMPEGTGRLSVDGGRVVAAGDDGPTRVLATRIAIPRDESASVVFEFEVPRSLGAITVEPSARVPEVKWETPSSSWTSRSAEEIPIPLR